MFIHRCIVRYVASPELIFKKITERLILIQIHPHMRIHGVPPTTKCNTPRYTCHFTLFMSYKGNLTQYQGKDCPLIFVVVAGKWTMAWVKVGPALKCKVIEFSWPFGKINEMCVWLYGHKASRVNPDQFGCYDALFVTRFYPKIRMWKLFFKSII